MDNKTSPNNENGNESNSLLAAVNPFIASTAKDYDMCYESVEVYYNRYGSTPLFYLKLEDHIKQRTSTNEAQSPDFLVGAVSGSLPNWWDLQIVELKELEEKIKERLKQLEGNES